MWRNGKSRAWAGAKISICPSSAAYSPLSISPSIALVTSMAKRENLTIRQVATRVAGARAKAVVYGSPQTIADMMEEWFRKDGCDGFNIMPPFLPGGLDDFVDMVIPELQRRGLFRTAYEGRTLRENLGLRRPPSRHVNSLASDAPSPRPRAASGG